MKTLFVLIGIMSLATCKPWMSRYAYPNSERCINMWDEGCINGQLPGSGGDDDFVNGGFNPGKRCLAGEGCSYGKQFDSGADYDYLNDGFNPRMRRPLGPLKKMQKIHANI